MSKKENYNEYMRVYMVKRYHKKRSEIFERLGGKCKSCECDHDLEVDHCEYAGKAFNIAKLWSISKEKLEIELAKCQLLCYTCHKSKTSNEGSLANYQRIKVCTCGKVCDTIKQYAGHKRWCNTGR